MHEFDSRTLIAIGGLAVGVINLACSGFNGWLGLRIRASVGESESRTKTYVDEKLQDYALEKVCLARAERKVA
jgi:hypothetical protein